MNDQHTLPTPTLDAERTDQLRTFLTVEAAADTAAGGARTRSAHTGRRRLALGGVAAVLLAGGLLASTAIIASPGSTPADAVAIEEANGWINVRIVDLDADPDAVVEQLLAAGIDARATTAAETGLVAAGLDGPAVTGLSVEAPDGTGVGMVSVGPEGAPPLEVDPGIDPADPSITAPAVTTVDAVGSAGASGAGADSTEGGADAAPAGDLQVPGVRFEADGSISIRAGAEVTVLVFAAA